MKFSKTILFGLLICNITLFAYADDCEKEGGKCECAIVTRTVVKGRSVDNPITTTKEGTCKKFPGKLSGFYCNCS